MEYTNHEIKMERDWFATHCAELHEALLNLTEYVSLNAFDKLVREKKKIVGWEKTERLNYLLRKSREAIDCNNWLGMDNLNPESIHFLKRRKKL